MKITSLPTMYEYALLSNDVYTTNSVAGTKMTDNPDWQICYAPKGDRDYLGMLYINDKSHQLVLSHRGTNSTVGWMQDLAGVFKTWDVLQKHGAFYAVAKAVEIARQKNYRLSFTGHSLGGFLAELSVYFCHKVASLNYPEVGAVTFESPGAKSTIEGWQGQHAPLDLSILNVVGYVSYPNLVNTCNAHIGSLYTIASNLNPTYWPAWYSEQTHSMKAMVEWFKQSQSAKLVIDWPVGNQYREFFKHHKLVQGRYQEKDIKDFIDKQEHAYRLALKGNFGVDTKLHDKNSMALRQFSKDAVDFLVKFHDILWNDLTKDAAKQQRFAQQLKEKNIPVPIITCLTGFRILNITNTLMVVLSEDVFKTVPENKDIFYFRRLMNEWLGDNTQANTFIELLKLTGVSLEDKRLKISAVGLGEGVQIGENATIKMGNIVASGVKIAEVKGENLAEQIKTLMQDLVEKVSSITATAVPASTVIPKGANLEFGNIEATAINMASASTTPMFNQAPVVSSHPVSAFVPIEIGDCITYTPGTSLCKVELTLTEVPKDKYQDIQTLMAEYADTCENESDIIKNHSKTKILALHLKEKQARSLVAKLCSHLKLDNPLLVSVSGVGGSYEKQF